MASDKATEAVARAIEGISWAKWPDSTETAMAEGAGIDFARAALEAGRPYLVADELKRQATLFRTGARDHHKVHGDSAGAETLITVAEHLESRAAELRAEVSDGQ